MGKEYVRTEHPNGTVVVQYLDVPPLVHIKPTRIESVDFFRLLTPQERSALRPLVGGQKLRDLKEDFERGGIVLGDTATQALMLDSGLFTQARIDELFS